MDQQHSLVLLADDLQGLCLVLDRTPTSSASLLAILLRSMLTDGWKGIAGSTLNQRLHVHSIAPRDAAALHTLADALQTACLDSNDKTHRGVSLILDDASVLHALAHADSQQWHTFLHTCHSTLSSAGRHNFTVVADGGVASDAQWTTALHHRAQTVFSVDPFPEGSSLMGRTAQVVVEQRVVLGDVGHNTHVLRCALRATDVVCCLDRLESVP